MYRFVLLIDCEHASHKDALRMLQKLLTSTASRLDLVGLHPQQYATLTNKDGKDIGSMYLLEKEIIQ